MKIILFISLAFPYVGLGQNYFNQLIDLSSNAEVYRDILYDDGTNSFWAFGTVSNSTNPKVFHFDAFCNGLDTFDIENNSAGDQYYSPYGNGVFFDNTSNIIISGQVEYFGFESNAVISKINMDGDTVWVKEIGDSSYYDSLLSGLQDTDSTYIFAGCSGTNITSNIVDFWLIKTDTNGNILWQNNYGGGGTELNFALDTVTGGGFILSGYTNSYGAGGNDIYIIKTDENGILIWQKWYGLEQSEGGFTKTLPNGNILVYGSYKFISENGFESAHHGIAMELDQNGNQLWGKFYANADTSNSKFYLYNEVFNSVAIVSNGLVYCGFSADTLDNNPLGWVVKTDFNGNELWSRRYRKRDNDNYFQDVVALPSGDLVFTGFVFPENTSQTQDGWLVRTNCLGFDGPPTANGIWHNASLNTVILENDSERFGDGIIYWGDGTSTTFTEFEDSLISHTYAASGNYNIQLIVNACSESDTTYISADATVTGLVQASTTDFNLYPNPANDILNIDFMSTEFSSEIIIQSLSGQIVFQSLVTSESSIQIDVTEFAAGTYLVSFINSTDVVTKKLIIN